MSTYEPHIDPEDCGADVAPYVLGALTEEEHQAFRRHVASCGICREEVAALQVVTAALPAAAPQLNAPAELKRRVMSSVREDPRLRPSAAPPRSSPAAALDWLRWRPALGASALAAAAIAVVALVLSSGGGSGGERVIRAEVPGAPRASALLRLSGGHAELSIADLPQTPSSRVYEVWIKRSGTPQPTDALFDVAADGTATVGVPGSVVGVKEILVTSEPLGGSRVPTRAPVIVAHLS